MFLGWSNKVKKFILELRNKNTKPNFHCFILIYKSSYFWIKFLQRFCFVSSVAFTHNTFLKKKDFKIEFLQFHFYI